MRNKDRREILHAAILVDRAGTEHRKPRCAADVATALRRTSLRCDVALQRESLGRPCELTVLKIAPRNHFSQDNDIPLSVGIVVDTSASMLKRIDTALAAVERFIGSIFLDVALG